MKPLTKERDARQSWSLAALKQLRNQLGRQQPPSVCFPVRRVHLRRGWRWEPTWAWHEYHSVTPEVSLCSLVGLPDFGEAAFGSALGAESSLAVNHSSQNRSLEGKPKPVLCRGSVQADVQTLVDQCHLLKRRRCSRQSSGSTSEHLLSARLFPRPQPLMTRLIHSQGPFVRAAATLVLPNPPFIQDLAFSKSWKPPP